MGTVWHDIDELGEGTISRHLENHFIVKAVFDHLVDFCPKIQELLGKDERIL